MPKTLIGKLRFFENAFADCGDEFFRILVLLLFDEIHCRFYERFGACDFFMRSSTTLTMAPLFGTLVDTGMKFHMVSSIVWLIVDIDAEPLSKFPIFDSL